MSAIVTIFEDELKNKSQLLSSICEMSDQVRVVGTAYVINPKPGKLFAILGQLRENKIAYGTHFNSSGKNSTET